MRTIPKTDHEFILGSTGAESTQHLRALIEQSKTHVFLLGKTTTGSTGSPQQGEKAGEKPA